MASIFIGISAWADEGLLKSSFYPPGIMTPAIREKGGRQADDMYDYLTGLRNYTNGCRR